MSAPTMSSGYVRTCSTRINGVPRISQSSDAVQIWSRLYRQFLVTTSFNKFSRLRVILRQRKFLVCVVIHPQQATVHSVFSVLLCVLFVLLLLTLMHSPVTLKVTPSLSSFLCIALVRVLNFGRHRPNSFETVGTGLNCVVFAASA